MNDNDIVLNIYRDLLSLKTSYITESLQLEKHIKDNSNDTIQMTKKILLYTKIQVLSEFLQTFDKHINLNKEILFKDEYDHLNENNIEVETIIPRYCDDCKYLKPKEQEQTKEKEFHMCLKYNKQVMHLGEHPKIRRLKECDE